MKTKTAIIRTGITLFIYFRLDKGNLEPVAVNCPKPHLGPDGRMSNSLKIKKRLRLTTNFIQHNDSIAQLIPLLHIEVALTNH